MAILQLVQVRDDLTAVPNPSRAAPESFDRTSVAESVMLGSVGLVTVGLAANDYGFRLVGVTLRSLAGRFDTATFDEAEDRLTALMQTRDPRALLLLDESPSVYVERIDLEDAASHRRIRLGRYGVLDVVGPDSPGDSLLARVIELVRPEAA